MGGPTGWQGRHHEAVGHAGQQARVRGGGTTQRTPPRRSRQPVAVETCALALVQRAVGLHTNFVATQVTLLLQQALRLGRVQLARLDSLLDTLALLRLHLIQLRRLDLSLRSNADPGQQGAGNDLTEHGGTPF
jgi:hypothetical protein